MPASLAAVDADVAAVDADVVSYPEFLSGIISINQRESFIKQLIDE